MRDIDQDPSSNQIIRLLHDADQDASSVGSATGGEVGARVDGAVQSALHQNLGNGLVGAALAGADLGGIGGLVSGGLAAGIAGMDVGLSPGLAANSVMMQVLRRDRGVDDVGSVLASLDMSGGQALSDEERERFEAAFTHDFSHVRVHTDSKARAASEGLRAHAFALGSHVFFGPGEWSPGTPGTDRLLAHELTHVVQHDEGRLPTGGDEQVSSPSDPAEVEAYANEDRILARLDSTSAAPSPALADGFTRGLGAPAEAPAAVEAGPGLHDLLSELGSDAFAEAPSAGDAALRQAAEEEETAMDADEEAAPAAPETVRLTLAGVSIEVSLPSSASAGTTVRGSVQASPFPGLTINGAEITFDGNFSVVGGSVTGTLELGDYVAPTEIALSVNAGSGTSATIAADIEGAPFTLGEHLTGTMDLHVGTDGIRGVAVFTPENISLPHGLSVSGGAIAVALDSTGEFTVAGVATGELEGIGTWTLSASFADGALTGDLAVDLGADGLELSEGVRLMSGNITGTFATESVLLGGGLTVRVQDQFEASIQGTLDPGAQLWSVQGSLDQLSDLPLDEEGTVVLSNGRLDVSVQENVLDTLSASGDLTVPHFTGTVQGTYDHANTSLTGTATLDLTEPIELGEGVTLEAAHGEVEVVDNALSQLSGSATLLVPYEGEPTFDVTADDILFDVDAAVVSGAVTVTTLRELTFGTEGAAVLTVLSGASAEATLAENAITQVTGGLDYKVADSVGEVGTGSIGFVLDEAGTITEATASMTLSSNYGIPDRTSEEAYLHTGSTVEITMLDSALQTVTLTSVGFTVSNPAGEGELTGTVEGTLDLDASSVSGTATTAISEDWPLPATWGEVTFTTGGEISVTVAENDITQVSGLFPFTAEIAAGQAPLQLSGEISGEYDRDAEILSGSLEATLDSDLPIPVGGDQLLVLAGSTVRAEVSEGTLSTLGLDVDARYDREGAPFLEGSITNGTYAVDTGMLGFTGDLTLLQPVEYQAASGFTLRALAGSTLQATVAESQLTSLDQGQLIFEVEDAEGLLFNGTVTDAAVNLESWSVSGTAALTAARDYQLGGADAAQGDRFDGWSLWLATGSAVAATIADNTFQSAAIDATIFAAQGDERMAEGSISGEYTVGDAAGYTGSVSATILQPIQWAVGERFGLTVKPGSTLTGQAASSVLTSATGNLTLALDEGGVDKVLVTVSADWTAGAALTADGSIEVVGDILVAQPAGHSLYLTAGTEGTAHIEQDALQSLDGTLVLRLDEGDRPIVRASISAAYEASAGTDASISGSGSIDVIGDIEIPAGEEIFVLQQGSGLTGTLADSQLQSLAGSLVARVEDGEGAWATAQATVDYDHAALMLNTLTGSIDITREKDLGAVGGDYTLFLEPGGGAQIDVAANELQTLSAQIPIRIDDLEGPLASVALDGTYTHASRSFTGTGTTEILRQVTVAEGVGEYSFYLLPGTGASAAVANNVLQEVTGDVRGSVHDGEGEFLHLEAGVTYTTEGGGQLDVPEGTITVTREKALPPVGDYAPFLLPSSGATVTIAANALESFGGIITVRIDELGEPLVQLDLLGSWTEATGLDGTGSAKLLVAEYEAANMGEFTLLLMSGAGADATMTAGQLVSLSADIPLAIKKGGGPFMTGNLNGTYMVQEEQFTGFGSLAVVEDELLLPFGDSQFWLAGGSNADLSIVNNQITSIGGDLGLSLRDGGGEYLSITFDGRYDLEGGTGFTGGGSATVLREKRLLELDGYAFAIIAGTGVEVTIVQNEITELGGQVPFRIYDSVGALLDGSVDGNWSRETGHVSGEGSVTLARDVEFGPVTILTGSGGSGSVVDSELQSFEGTLNALLSDGQGPLASLNATGTFDAVNNEIVELEGTVTVERDIEPIPGFIVRGLTGFGRIEHNEIREVSGGGTLIIEAVGVEGTFHAGWRKDGDADVYSGTATVGALDMDHEMGAEGRGIHDAQITATLNEDQTFDLSGSLQYNLTENIGGSLNIEMDETFDPVLSGTLEAEGTLMEGKELYSDEWNLFSGTAVIVFVPVSYGVQAGIEVGLEPLTYELGVEVGDFHLLDMNVPTLEGAHFGLNWGAYVDAFIAPYVGVGVRYDAFSLFAGLEGQVRLHVPLNIGIDADLHGGGDEFWGELAIGASINPSLTLALILAAEASLLGMGGEWDWEVASYTFEDMMNIEWSTTYLFGDRTGGQSGGAAAPASSGGSQTPITVDQPAEGTPSLGVGNNSSPAEGEAGLAVSGEDMGIPMGGGGGGFPNPMERYEPQIEDIKKGIDGVMGIVGILGSNPLTAPVAIYDNWDTICDYVDDIVDALAAVGEILRSLMPDWVNTLIDWVAEGIGAVADFFGEAWDAVTGVVSDVGDAISDGWDSVTSSVSSWF